MLLTAVLEVYKSVVKVTRVIPGKIGIAKLQTV